MSAGADAFRDFAERGRRTQRAIDAALEHEPPVERRARLLAEVLSAQRKCEEASEVLERRQSALTRAYVALWKHDNPLPEV